MIHPRLTVFPKTVHQINPWTKQQSLRRTITITMAIVTVMETVITVMIMGKMEIVIVIVEVMKKII